MAEDGRALLNEFRELFDELGEPDGSVKLRIVQAGSSVLSARNIFDQSLYKVIIDDPADRLKLGLLSIDQRIYKVWGGAIEPTGVTATTESAFLDAMNPGGGVLEGDKLYKLLDYRRDFSVGGVVMQWFLIAQAIKKVS